MNNWLRLALISLLGLIVSIVALNVLNTDDGMKGMNMGVTSNQSMTMGPANMPMANINQGQGPYYYFPGQWGMAVMRDRIPHWVKHRTNNIPMQNMNMNQMPMQNMNMQGNMGQMQM